MARAMYEEDYDPEVTLDTPVSPDILNLAGVSADKPMSLARRQQLLDAEEMMENAYSIPVPPRAGEDPEEQVHSRSKAEARELDRQRVIAQMVGLKVRSPRRGRCRAVANPRPACAPRPTPRRRTSGLLRRHANATLAHCMAPRPPNPPALPSLLARAGPVRGAGCWRPFARGLTP